MPVKITTAMLDKLHSQHDYMGCLKLREILSAAGVTDVELHVYETQKIKQLREEAAQITKRADGIEARGPWPAHLPRWTPGADDAA